MSQPKTLLFCFDYLSPYAYLAWPEIKKACKRLELELEPVPVLLAALLNHHGHKGPAEIPSKKIHTFKHVSRLASQLGVSIAPPPTHPFNPLLSLRLSCLVMPAADKTQLIDALFQAAWSSGVGVETPEQLKQALEHLPVDAAALIAAAQAPDNKKRLKDNTAMALEKGVFGVPTMLLGDELLWGLDAVPHLDMIVSGQDPCQQERWQSWQGIQASASRT